MDWITRERIRHWGPLAIGLLTAYVAGVLMDGKWDDLGPTFAGLQVISDLATEITLTKIAFVALVLVVIYLYSV